LNKRTKKSNVISCISHGCFRAGSAAKSF